MIRAELRELSRTPRDLRRFGWMVGGVFTALGVWFGLRHFASSPYLLGIGLALIAFGWVYPRALKPVYLGWMALALVLGLVVSHVILTLFFFLVLTPVGLLARLLGKDFLRLRLDRQARTYWLKRPPQHSKSPAAYERQF
jgi:hypothetical protein